MVFDPPQPVMPARVAVLPVPLAEHNRRILKRPAATRGDVAARANVVVCASRKTLLSSFIMYVCVFVAY